MAKPASHPTASSGAADASAQESAEAVAAGKGRPTPTRKEREAANLRPLVSNDRRASSKAAKAKYNEARERARIGMAKGDEKFLPVRDKGEQRRYIRQYVDARFSIGEVMIPIMLAIIVLSFIDNWQVQVASVFALWAFFIIAVVDCLFAGYTVNKRLAAKYGQDKLQRGNKWYTAMRCLQMRRMRLPKPQNKRGEYPA